jgi:hypothetical protein
MFEMATHAIRSNWFLFAAINIINMMLILLIFVWKRQTFALTWIVVISCMLLLCFAPQSLRSTLAILILFLCYTLLPLQLKPSALAAGAITIVAGVLEIVYYTGSAKQVNIFYF